MSHSDINGCRPTPPSTNGDLDMMNIGSESEYIEHKLSTAETAKGIDSMASMLNKHGKGTLYFGVKNSGDVVGQTVGERTLNQLSQNIARDIRPTCFYSVAERSTADGRSFIEVTFHGSRPPYASRGRYFIRFHDEDRQMDNDMLRHYYLDQRQDYSSWERASSGSGIADVDEDLLRAYLERSAEKGRLSLAYTDARTVLGKLGLLYDTEKLNNAGNVLFSKEGPVRLKLAKFASETRLTVLDLQVFAGNVYECIDKGMDFVSSSIDWHLRFTGAARREEVAEIPMIALREIVVNAFAHGDYDASTDFEIDVYADRVCVYSPGMFPKPYTPEDFARRGIEPIPLNKKISETLFRDGTIEQVSTGFERVFDACADQDVRYAYEETATGFRFTFYRRGAGAERKLTATEERIVAAMQVNPLASTKELAETCGVSVRTVQRLVKTLTKGGVVVRMPAGDGYVWETDGRVRP